MELRIGKNGKAMIVKIIKMTIMSQKDLLLSPKNWSRIANLFKRLQQSFRLMVGVPDYQTYLDHMKKQNIMIFMMHMQSGHLIKDMKIKDLCIMFLNFKNL